MELMLFTFTLIFCIVFWVLFFRLLGYIESKKKAENVQPNPNVNGINPLDVEREKMVTKWRNTAIYQEFLSKVESQIEIHIDTIKEKNDYFDELNCQDMYCIDITEQYYRLRTVTDRDHRFDCSWTVSETSPGEAVLIGVSFFDIEYQNINYKQIKGFHDAICMDLKKYEASGIKISSSYNDGEDGWPSAYIWIDFKEIYKKLNPVFE